MAARAARSRAAAAAEAAAAPPAGTVTMKLSSLVLLVLLVAVLLGGGVVAVLYFATDVFGRDDGSSARAAADDEPVRKTKKHDDDDASTARASSDLATALGPLFGKKDTTAAPSTARTATATAGATAGATSASLAGAPSRWTGPIDSDEKNYASELTLELSGLDHGDIGVVAEVETFTGAAEEIPAGRTSCSIHYRRPMSGTVSSTEVHYGTVAGRPESNTCRAGTELAADTKDDVTCRLGDGGLTCRGTYNATLVPR
jgi:hypothetical protein